MRWGMRAAEQGRRTAGEVGPRRYAQGHASGRRGRAPSVCAGACERPGRVCERPEGMGPASTRKGMRMARKDMRAAGGDGPRR